MREGTARDVPKARKGCTGSSGEKRVSLVNFAGKKKKKKKRSSSDTRPGKETRSKPAPFHLRREDARARAT